jgi:hypothetical protein
LLYRGESNASIPSTLIYITPVYATSVFLHSDL